MVDLLERLFTAESRSGGHNRGRRVRAVPRGAEPTGESTLHDCLVQRHNGGAVNHLSYRSVRLEAASSRDPGPLSHSSVVLAGSCCSAGEDVPAEPPPESEYRD